MKPTPETMAEYIREDLEALNSPLRKDQKWILEELRSSFRAYRHLAKMEPKADWSAK